MINNNLHILTRCTRINNLKKVYESIKESNWNIIWHIIFDTSVVSDIPTFIYTDFIDATISVKHHYIKSSDKIGHDNLNVVIGEIIDNNDFIYILDDDNILHENFLKESFNYISGNEDANGIIFSQKVNFKDFANVDIRYAKEENIAVGKIDMAQFLLKKKCYEEIKFSSDYVSDGMAIEKIYKTYNIHILDKVLCYYNAIDKEQKNSYPNILVVGEQKPTLETTKVYEHDAQELNVSYVADADVIPFICKNKIDSIISIGKTHTDFQSLQSLPLMFRQKWLHRDNSDIENIGDVAYNSAMDNILKNDNSKLISVCTPVYNTSETVLIRTYNSLKNQAYNNWEWSIVNDGSNLRTKKVLNELRNADPRISLYEFNKQSDGIGDVKYKAFTLARGEILVELDHDDILTTNALETLYNAHLAYPHVGFFYSNCVEVDNNWNSLKYVDGFAFGYGKYRKENVFNLDLDVCVSTNINPITIRHIVSSPNHLRAWTKNAYYEIGGHNRNLPIVDDYELVVRSFLKTHICKINSCLYLQFYDGNNSQNSRRADIQRRVKTVAQFYAEQIKSRFEELGKEDWAFEMGIRTEPKTGDEEGCVNYIF